MKKTEYQRFSRRLKLPAARSSGRGCIKLRDFSLSSIGWRRGLGRGGAFLLVSPLLGPLPARSSRGEDGELDAAIGAASPGCWLTRGAIFLPLAQGLCYSRRMIRRLSFCLIALVLGAGLESRSAAETFKLADGGELTGEPIAFGRDGVAVKKPDGSFSAKVAWTNFTQEALQQLATLPRAK